MTLENFKLPLLYQNKIQKIDENVINDLELTETLDENCEPISNYFFNNDNDISKKITQQISKYYTTDTQFLKEQQKLLQTYKPLGIQYTDYSKNYKNILSFHQLFLFFHLYQLFSLWYLLFVQI